ncbi:MAG: hypothetical protein L0332_34640, partial [Chloroflexi bacterium]|nr:hypothetical protein [Chloroflexota bacterium]MCI0731834.1 hypothetical protein [Chloroflexota bacterium]
PAGATPAAPTEEAPPGPTPAAPSTAAAPLPTAAPVDTQGVGGQVTYRAGDRVYRLAASEGATPEEISLALDQLAPGEDEWLNISATGEWLLLSTTRFDAECAGWACLVLLPGDLSTFEVVRAGGVVLHPASAAVAAQATTIVYEDGGGPQERDLWVVYLQGDGWSTPQLLTGESPYAYNSLPSLSPDGGRVLFDCGAVPYGQEGTAICLVDIASGDFQVVLAPDQGPETSEQNALHHPAFAPDGSIVFEADWQGERIWRLPAGGTEPVLVSTEFSNDNSPCVLPDGRIASLWLNRPGGSGLHEIKVMTADGSDYFMALIDVDVTDSGLGCGL